MRSRSTICRRRSSPAASPTPTASWRSSPSPRAWSRSIDAETLEELARAPGRRRARATSSPATDGRFYVTDTGGDALLVYEGEDRSSRLLDRDQPRRQPLRDRDRRTAGPDLGDPNRPQSRSRSSRSPIWPPRSSPTTRPCVSPTASASTSAPAASSSSGSDDGDVQIFDPEGADAVSRLERLGRARRGVGGRPHARRSRRRPNVGPFRRDFWTSPLRGRWLTSFLGSALLPLLVIAGDHRLRLPRRLRPRPRRQRPDRRLRVRPLLLRLADEPDLALLADPVAAPDRRLRRDPDPAGEALVGDPAALRAAPGPLDRARARAAQRAAAGRLLDLPASSPA